MAIKYWPMAKGSYQISSGFENRINPVTGQSEQHLGLDFAAPKGTPFYAPADGICVEGSERSDVSGFGKWVWLDCQDSVGRDFIFGHGDPAVRGGDTIKAGQIVGRVNTYGQSTGPHLHAEVWTPPGRLGGTAVDPAIWFKDALFPGEIPIPSPKEANKLQDPTTRTQISPNKEGGWRDVWWIGIHTQQGGRTAAGLVDFTCDPNSEVAYNCVVDDREIVLTVPWNMNPWSAAGANQRADHICAAGSYAEWSRGKWLETDASDGKNEDLELTKMAQITAWRCQERNIPPVYVGNFGDGPYPPAKRGICGHMDFGTWGGGHHDPGENFPWDEFIKRVNAFYTGGTMGFLDETMTNFDKSTVTVRTVLYFVDQKIEAIRKQVVDGWKQLGVNTDGKPLTLIDSQAAQNAKLDKIIELEGQILELGQKTYDFLTKQPSA